MRHIVAYDIKDKTRLKKISQICLDYGIRIQYSVFEFDLSLEVAAEFLQEVTGIIDSAADKILVIPVCESCLGCQYVSIRGRCAKLLGR